MVFITRFSPVHVTDFTLSLSEDGRLQSSLSLATGYLLYPQWLHLAVTLAKDAKNASTKTDQAWRGKSAKRQADTLEREVRYAAGAVAASVASIDGLYGWLQHIELQDPSQNTSKRNGTSRFAKVSEKIRTSFKVDSKSSNKIREHLKLMFNLRDQAIHPNPMPSTPIEHPRLKSLMNQNLANFHAGNAIGCTQSAVNIIYEVFELSRSKDGRVKEHIEQIKPEVIMIKRKADLLSN